MCIEKHIVFFNPRADILHISVPLPAPLTFRSCCKPTVAVASFGLQNTWYSSAIFKIQHNVTKAWSSYTISEGPWQNFDAMLKEFEHKTMSLEGKPVELFQSISGNTVVQVKSMAKLRVYPPLAQQLGFSVPEGQRWIDFSGARGKEISQFISDSVFDPLFGSRVLRVLCPLIEPQIFNGSSDCQVGMITPTALTEYGIYTWLRCETPIFFPLLINVSEPIHTVPLNVVHTASEKTVNLHGGGCYCDIVLKCSVDH